jgi:17beta-estradiol 17-dehydrogenase / very-long-chain 3-oxoacyl-CoA reductase
MAATAALLHAAGWAGASQPLLDAVAAEPGGIASLSGTLLALGLAALLALGLAVVRMLLRLLELLRMLVTKPDLDRLCGSGTWACVTGATDGIGRAYALELASQGMPVLLLSRTEGKLEATAAEVRALGVECDWLAVDMSRGEEIYPVIRAFLSNYDVGFLVNNVGASYDHAEFFAELPAPKVQELLNMNIQTATMLCHAVLPQMAERSAGVIVNVSSWLGSRPCGLYAVYSASKAYVDVFSRALAQEYGPSGVTVQSLMPQFVVSKLSKMRRASRPVPCPALPCPALPCPALPALPCPATLRHALRLRRCVLRRMHVCARARVRACRLVMMIMVMVVVAREPTTGPTLTCPLPEQYAASALQSVGYAGGASGGRTTGYLPQEITWWLSDRLPDALVSIPSASASASASPHNNDNNNDNNRCPLLFSSLLTPIGWCDVM